MGAGTPLTFHRLYGFLTYVGNAERYKFWLFDGPERVLTAADLTSLVSVSRCAQSFLNGFRICALGPARVCWGAQAV